MTYIKKIVMQGFKSFAKRTEIPLENSMNVIVGPNGSGKSNISDAICFVLGRLSTKSIRAAKAANLLFSGSKKYKPAQEAFVEIILDNSDKTFTIDSPEISIKRILKRNGQSIYKINNQVKTRQELLELLAQGGIDPNGFNIILQGEIGLFIKKNAEERRKIIEEVAGISIYETRKQKSLREMEKTDEKLRQVTLVLKEKNAYLKNLEKERQEALNYQKLEETIRRCKATIIDKNIKEKQKKINELNGLIEAQNKEIEKIKAKIDEKNSEIAELEEKINKIYRLIQSSTGDEQVKIHKEIADLKAVVAGLEVRKENFENRLQENLNKRENLSKKIEELEDEIKEIKDKSPEIKKQQDKQEEIQRTLDTLEKKRKKFYSIKSEIATLENQKSEKQNSLIETKKEIALIEKSVLDLYNEIKFEKSLEKSLSLKNQILKEIDKIKSEIEIAEKKKIEVEKQNAIINQSILEEEKLKKEIPQSDICPLCRNKITEEHRNYVLKQADEKIKILENRLNKNKGVEQELKEKIGDLKNNLEKLEEKINDINIDLLKIKNAEEKKQKIKQIYSVQKQLESEIEELDKKIADLKKSFEKLKNIDEEYEEARLRMQELSFKDIDVDTELIIKQKELTRLKGELRAIKQDDEESNQELEKINEELARKTKIIEEKEKQEQELYEKSKKLFDEKNEIQDKQKAIETSIIGLQHQIRNHEDKINSFNIEKAQLKAQLETLQSEFKEFENTQLISLPIEKVKEKLNKCQLKISQFSNPNFRAIDVYEKVKEQCELIKEKVAVIEKEKEKILKTINEIDKKKKKVFMEALNAINGYFSRNFSQLSKKGEVFLDLENKQDPFDGGLNIIVKVGRGKYFDVTSLSGGEKTLVALSLIFAIQEYKPYCFYLFDEIDVALDKHNSELLAALIKKYMTSGQYLIITHNDALISEATTLYGVSMQDNISKIISLKV